MDDEEKIVKVNFKEKRPKPGAKPKPDFFQSRPAGMMVLGALLALALLAHFFLLDTPAAAP